MYHIIDMIQKKKKKRNKKLQILQRPFSPLYLPFLFFSYLFFFDKTKPNNLSIAISIDLQFSILTLRFYQKPKNFPSNLKSARPISLNSNNDCRKIKTLDCISLLNQG